MAYLGRQPNTGVRSRYIYTATASQTTFSGSDDDGKTLKYEDAAYLDVFLNGVLLKPVTDYTATSKTSVVLTSGAAVSDIVEIVAYDIANIANTVSATNGGTFEADVTVQGTVTADGLTVDTNTLYVDSANNRVGIGTATPDTLLEVSGASGNASIKLARSDNASTNDDFGSIVFENSAGTTLASIRGVSKSGNTEAGITFGAGGSDATRVTIDNGGNLLVGKTTTAFGTAGVRLANTENYFTVDSSATADFNRLTNDGDIVKFYKDGTTVGNIGAATSSLFIGTPNRSNIAFATNAVIPANNVGGNRDNAIDLGESSVRYDDIYATNGTIQTSDANEKQDIAELDEAEKRVATAAKGLIRKFRWIDSVEEKNDDARIHVGIIAQDLKAAFEAEGLDPGRYAMFISTTWWEADETYTDDEGVEQTRTNTYDTAEEAPEGAIERTRLGVRYNQLLAFIIGAM